MAWTMKFSTKDHLRALRRLKEKAPIAQMRALNRTAASGRTFLARAIADDLNLPVNKVRGEIQIQEAVAIDLRARLSVSKRRLPLILFGAKGRIPTRGRGPGVTARLPGGANSYPRAFIATVRGPLPTGILSGGHLGVFERKGPGARKSPGAWSKNLPIVQLKGPSLGKVFLKLLPQAYAYAKTLLPKNLTHEFQFALREGAQ